MSGLQWAVTVGVAALAGALLAVLKSPVLLGAPKVTLTDFDVCKVISGMEARYMVTFREAPDGPLRVAYLGTGPGGWTYEDYTTVPASIANEITDKLTTRMHVGPIRTERDDSDYIKAVRNVV